MRKAYIRIKLPEELTDYVAYIVTNRLLGYRSMIEFVSAATRKEVMRLRQQQFIPPTVPKVRKVSPGAIGVLSCVLGVALIALLFLLPPTTTGLGILDDIFSPLQGFDIPALYQRFHGFINFTLYFVCFFAILFSVTKRWFDRREALLVAMAFAIALSVALALVPTNWLRQLSPFALLILALVLFYAVFEALRHFGFAWISSGSFAYILAYLLLRTHRPDLFQAAGPYGSVLNLAFFIAFLIAIYKAASEVWKKSDITFARAGYAARLAWSDTFGTQTERALLGQEQEELAKMLSIEREEFKKLNQIEQDLDRVEKAVRKYGYSKEALIRIAEELEKLRAHENELGQKLDALETLAERLRDLDMELFAKLKKKFDDLSPKEQRELKNAIEEKVTELNLETALPKLAQSAQDLQTQTDALLRETIAQLQRNQPLDALRSLTRARYCTGQLKTTLTQVNETEQAIQAFLNKPMRYFRK